jgi:D-aminopeptidase
MLFLYINKSNIDMSEEIKNTETKETKRPRGKKANAQATTEQPVEQVVEQIEEAIVEEVVETEIEVEAEVEVEEQVVEDAPATQQAEQVVEQPKTETFDLRTIKREAIRYNHCVFTYSDGFICHAVSRAKADAKHNAWLNRK